MSVVALVEDDESVCRALARVIRCAGYRVDAYPSAMEFLEHVGGRSDLGCLVLDVHLPDLSGLQVQRELAEAGVVLPIVFISGDGNVPAIVMAIRGGAEDFLIKPVDDTGLLDAIGRAVMRSAKLRAQTAEQNAILERIGQLTTREREVLQGVLTGHLNKQIASELGITEKTIKHYRAHVMDKLGAHCVAHLFQLAHMAGLTELAGARHDEPDRDFRA
ncbi:response regulator transcription factor [Paraburkholderia nemoris]|uniref:response regulator transcription factor n=1 Tax=Paraburkholderia nemoris TaxID=2793076 RepID=UPI001F45B0DE|nr:MULTISPECIES: response regulator [Paraburkholderia]